jgi:transcriptional regulator with XRE-family HTH domain
LYKFPNEITNRLQKGWLVKWRIRAVRKAKGVSQTTLARAIGKTPGAMWKYEHNLVPILAEDLYIIAQELGVTIDELAEDAKESSHA